MGGHLVAGDRGLKDMERTRSVVVGACRDGKRVVPKAVHRQAVHRHGRVIPM
jgi:hypothetical protein